MSSQHRYNTRSRARAARSQAASSGLSLPRSTSQLSSSPVPILTLGVTGCTSNFSKFRDAAYTHLTQVYGAAARVLIDHKVPNPRVVYNLDSSSESDDEDADDENSTRSPIDELTRAEINRIALLESVKANQKEKDEIRRALPKIYAFIWEHMSHDSRSRMRDYSDFPEIEANNDIVRLWKCIIDTHLVGVHQVPAIAKSKALHRYYACRQMAGESLPDFKKRVDDYILALVTLEVDEIPEDIKASDFISKLDNATWNPLKSLLENNAARGVEAYPATLSAAFKVVQDYKSISANHFGNTTSSSSSSAAFVTYTPPRDLSHLRSIPPVSRQSPVSLSSGSSRQSNRSNRSRGNRRSKSSSHNSNSSYSYNSNSSSSNANGGNTSMVSNNSTSSGSIHSVAPVTPVNAQRPSMSTPGGPVRHASARMTTTRHASAFMTFGRGRTVYYDNGRQINPMDILLDNQATQSIFGNRNLLDNIRTTEVTQVFEGVTPGNGLRTNKVGSFMEFEEVYYHPKATANILSMSETSKYMEIEYHQPTNTFRVESRDGCVYVFRLKDGLYVLSLGYGGSYVPNVRNFTVNMTVSQRESMYSVRQVNRAKRAKNLLRILGVRHPKTSIRAIGAAHNNPFTTDDFNLANASRVVDPPRIFDHRDPQVLHIDILSINGIKYLVSASTPLGLLMVTSLGKGVGVRSTASLRKALFGQLAEYKARKFDVGIILSDGEAGIEALRIELQQLGSILNVTAAGQHVPYVERRIREIKDHARGVFNSLPYKIPENFIDYLIHHTVYIINLIPHTGSAVNISPREAFTGNRVDVDLHLRIAFGDYAEVTNPYSNNTMIPRTDPAIALGHTGNLQGSVKFFSLSSNSYITRDQFTVLPTPDYVIQRMNRISTSNTTGPVTDLEFSILSRRQAVVEELNELQPSVDDTNNDTNILSSSEVASSLLPTINMPVIDAEDPDQSNDEDQVPQDDTVHNDDSDSDSVPELVDTNDNVSTTEDDNDIDEAITVPSYSPRVLRSNQGSDRVYYHHISGMPISKDQYESYQRSYVNISVKKGLQTMPDAADKAIRAELQQMIDKKVFHPVSEWQYKFGQMIRSFMFLKEKFSADGEFEKLKARMVAMGNLQNKSDSIYSQNNISSPTANITHIFTIAAVACCEDDPLFVRTCDIPGAFLHASMRDREHKVFVMLDPTLTRILVSMDETYQPFVRRDGTLVVQLDQALYGCVESPKLWYECVKKVLVDNGFIINPVDMCVFNIIYNGNQITVGIYVDDLIITCRRMEGIEYATNMLKTAFGDITIKDGDIQNYLGMTMDFTKLNAVTFTMKNYIENLLEFTQITGIATSPSSPSLFDINTKSPLLDNIDIKIFHKIVAKILYLAKRVRPDLLTCISMLSSRVQAPTVEDQDKLICLLKYINYTKDIGMTINVSSPIRVICSIDASYGIHPDGRGHAGMVVTLGNGPILTKSSKIKLTTKSSCESELIAVTEHIGEALSLREFMMYQGINTGPVLLLQDNMSTIQMLKNGRGTSAKSKHISIRHFWIKDRIEAGEVEVKYQPTDQMDADIMSKPLVGEKFIGAMYRMLNWTP